MSARPSTSTSTQKNSGSSRLDSGNKGTPSKSKANVEVVPDSEEDRVRAPASVKPFQRPFKEVIIISSDEEDEPVKSTPVPRKKNRDRPFPKSRRIVESSTESEGEAPATSKGKTPGLGTKSNPQKCTESILLPRLSFYQDEESTDEYYVPPGRDEAILVYDEPRSPKKPTRIPTTHPQVPQVRVSSTGGSVSNPATPAKKKGPKLPETPTAAPAANTPTQGSQRKPRVSKKVLEETRLAQLFEYAQNFFHEMNAAVFGNGLPQQTQLSWNKKLYTTAGKARWNKGRNDGAGLSQIELAPKILDCEERIRKTLAHEMCHLACWIINGNLQENHGPLFKSWASKVTRAKPDITISTTHDYDINHPFRWQCVDCTLIYGRFSKSINPNESRCGRCGDPNNTTKGTLVALHKERAKKNPQTPASKGSRMAAGKPRDSPSSIISRKSVSVTITETSSVSDDEDDVEVVELVLDASTSISAGGCGPTAESDSDIEFIAVKLTSTTLNA
ncbi:hypothetical protein AAF712_013577 [Marasmius tenuissimus]|uniref:SprT-like domain-containing protein n=1 Tax=Marasmius tenuissimus TaxID=585030 RepID=A0ABR2ZEM9_9AGAR|nr:hypothetical protein PM082_015044 [Marasmius tenuissimus]